MAEPQPWWRDPGGRPPWIRERDIPAWLPPLLMAPFLFATPISIAWGPLAGGIYVVVWLVVAFIVLVTRPVRGAEEGRRPC